MKEEYYSDNGRRYLILGDEENSGENSGYEMVMVCKNHFDIFLPVREHFANGNIAYEYDITGYRSLDEYSARKGIGLKEITQLGQAINRVRVVVEEFMLDITQIKIDTKYIFIKDEEVRFTYCPEKGKDFFIQLKIMWEDVLTSLEHSDKTAVMAAYGIYQDLLKGVFEPDRHLTHDGAVEVKRDEDEFYTNSEIAKEEIVEETEEENTRLKGIIKTCTFVGACAAVYGFAAMSEAKLNIFGLGRAFLICLLVAGAGACVFGMLVSNGRIKLAALTRIVEKTKLMEYSVGKEELENERAAGLPDGKVQNENGGATQYLTLDAISPVREGIVLVQKATGEEIMISKFPSTLGSMSNCNVIISGIGVSRVHAVITKQDGVVQIEDMDSTNGTWLNGEKLVGGQKYVLKEKALLRFAVAEYEVLRCD